MQRKKTKPISKNSLHYKYIQNRSPKVPESMLVTVKKDITLTIRRIPEYIHITNGKPILIGRFDKERRMAIDLDLTPYGALKYGVSRLHARFELDDKQRLYIIDLGSTNGTMLAGRRLKPNLRNPVLHGQKIAFGTLVTKVLFTAPA